jgi:hypothetical protein
MARMRRKTLIVCRPCHDVIHHGTPERERLAGLRALTSEFPDSLIIAADVLVGTDVITHGGAAAVGLTGSLRQPKRPWDDGGPSA